MEIPQRMAVTMSSLVFAGAAVLTMGAAAPASAASTNTAGTNAVTTTASAVLPTSWCSRHPWRCNDDFIGDFDDFDDFGGGFGSFDDFGGGGIDISNENINISSSGQFGF